MILTNLVQYLNFAVQKLLEALFCVSLPHFLKLTFEICFVILPKLQDIVKLLSNLHHVGLFLNITSVCVFICLFVCVCVDM